TGTSGILPKPGQLVAGTADPALGNLGVQFPIRNTKFLVQKAKVDAFARTIAGDGGEIPAEDRNADGPSLKDGEAEAFLNARGYDAGSVTQAPREVRVLPRLENDRRLELPGKPFPVRIDTLVGRV